MLQTPMPNSSSFTGHVTKFHYPLLNIPAEFTSFPSCIIGAKVLNSSTTQDSFSQKNTWKKIHAHTGALQMSMSCALQQSAPHFTGFPVFIQGIGLTF